MMVFAARIEKVIRGKRRTVERSLPNGTKKKTSSKAQTMIKRVKSNVSSIFQQTSLLVYFDRGMVINAEAGGGDKKYYAKMITQLDTRCNSLVLARCP